MRGPAVLQTNSPSGDQTGRTTATSPSRFPISPPHTCSVRIVERPIAGCLDAESYLHSLWELLRGGMQEHMTLVGQVHVNAVGAKVIGHRQLVVAMVAHLLHDLQRVEAR